MLMGVLTTKTGWQLCPTIFKLTPNLLEVQPLRASAHHFQLTSRFLVITIVIRIFIWTSISKNIQLLFTSLLNHLWLQNLTYQVPGWVTPQIRLDFNMIQLPTSFFHKKIVCSHQEKPNIESSFIRHWTWHRGQSYFFIFTMYRRAVLNQGTRQSGGWRKRSRVTCHRSRMQ